MPLSNGQSAIYYPEPPPEPLNIVIVGAGISGLTAATALRRSGHNVRIFEQSRFSNEIGAAIHVGSNASRCLRNLGYSEKRLAGVPSQGLILYNNSAEKLREMPNSDILEHFGSPWYLTHRVDLHNELKFLALNEEGEGRPCDLILSSKVELIDAEAGLVVLENGKTYEADLIVGADGIHSLVRETVFDPAKPQTTGEAAYRFIIKSEKITEDPRCLQFDPRDGYLRIMVASDRRVVIYPCRNYDLLNFVCIHAQQKQKEEETGWNNASSVADLVETYKDFSPQIVNMLKKAEDVNCWQLLKRQPIESWVKGKVCLIGDAAHPMLPHQGQGGGQAIEDGAALGTLFTPETTRDQVLAVLKLYQQVRYSRASKVAWLSETQMAGESRLKPQIVQQYIFGHDVMEYAKHARSSEFIM